MNPPLEPVLPPEQAESMEEASAFEVPAVFAGGEEREERPPATGRPSGDGEAASLPELVKAISERQVSGTLAGPAGGGEEDEGEEVVAEQDPSGRFSRYSQEVGKGRFKHVYRGFDEKQGIDVAWSKIAAGANHLTDEQMHSIVAEMSKGLGLDHPHIVRCYKCWEDTGTRCINLITEYFASGNLRDYRQRHKHLDMKAVKKWGRQILSGLLHLHTSDPPMVHGDLRCDKIYINGHTGEIKIGDLGLATLLVKRFDGSSYANGAAVSDGDIDGEAGPGPPSSGQGPANEGPLSKPADIFSFGLCMLELVSLKKLEAGSCDSYRETLTAVQDPSAQMFIEQCLGMVPERPTACDLMEDPFLSKKVASAVHDAHDAGEVEGTAIRRRMSQRNADRDLETYSSVLCEVGVVRGEDYTFEFSGTITEGTLTFRLHMQYEGDDDDEVNQAPEVGTRTIDFVYDPEVDTPEKIADEISGEFNLSSTDRDICAAALKEWLARNAPDPK